ncbi:MAG: NUDIX hydrolase [Chlamydiota bacterium]|nr:NUDIX hydrolase [Chlamydiota bacterium]
MTIQTSYHQTIENLIKTIEPYDAIEKSHQKDALNWIKTGAPLCRIAKPDTPPKHLVSYFILLDTKKRQLLLVDHKKALLWLPPGGHVEPEEHPTAAAFRELEEELNIKLSLLKEDPLFITVTKTVGKTAGHTDVTLWYVFSADSSVSYTYDQSEFETIKWYSLDDLPMTRTDPNLSRFCNKLRQFTSTTFCNKEQL